MKSFSMEMVEQLTPYLLVWEKDSGTVVSSNALAKLWSLPSCDALRTNEITIIRPNMGRLEFVWIGEMTRLTLHLAHASCSDRLIRGQFIEDAQRWVFVGNPYVFSIEDLHRIGLQIGDLPLHDSTGDLLIAAETTQAAFQQTKDKAAELAHLNEELSSANRMLSGLIPEQVRSALGFESDGEEDLAQGMLLVGQVIDNLQAAVEFRERFLATMSHELRTPLNAILGLSEAILEGVYGELTEGQSRGLETVHSSGQHLLSLINDVLDMSKIESGETVLRPRETTASRVCETTVTMLQQLATEKGLNLYFEDLSEGVFFECDVRRIRQVLVNLVGNAVKFTDNGDVVLRASFDEPNDRVVFDVKDTGIGMGAEVLEKIFSAFYQVEQDLNRSHEGTGLGLAITKHTIEMHHGEISVTSTPGEGSCFTFWLPRQSPILDEVEAVLSDLQD